jgi:hypothetical protein
MRDREPSAAAAMDGCFEIEFKYSMPVKFYARFFSSCVMKLLQKGFYV